MITSELDHVVQVIPDLGVGGAERMLLNLVRELRGTAKLAVVSLWPPVSDSRVELDLAAEGVNVIHLHKRPGADMAVFHNLARTLDALAPDIVHTHRMAVRYALPWSMRHRARHIHTVHTVAQREGTTVDRVILKRAYRRDRVTPVACGPLVADSVREVYGISPHVVDNGVAPEFFQDWVRPARTGRLRLACIARLVDVKNHALLLRAVAAAREQGLKITADLAGDGPLRGELERLVARLDLAESVNFLGQVSDVRDVLRQADISVLTSRYEGLPLSALESMAMGIPVLANAVGGLPVLLGGGGGWLFDGSVGGLTGQLTYLAKRPAEVIEEGRRGRFAAASRYSASAMARGYLSIYNGSAELPQ